MYGEPSLVRLGCHCYSNRQACIPARARLEGVATLGLGTRKVRCSCNGVNNKAFSSWLATLVSEIHLNVQMSAEVGHKRSRSCASNRTPVDRLSLGKCPTAMRERKQAGRHQERPRLDISFFDSGTLSVVGKSSVEILSKGGGITRSIAETWCLHPWECWRLCVLILLHNMFELFCLFCFPRVCGPMRQCPPSTPHPLRCCEHSHPRNFTRSYPWIQSQGAPAFTLRPRRVFSPPWHFFLALLPHPPSSLSSSPRIPPPNPPAKCFRCFDHTSDPPIKVTARVQVAGFPIFSLLPAGMGEPMAGRLEEEAREARAETRRRVTLDEIDRAKDRQASRTLQDEHRRRSETLTRYPCFWSVGKSFRGTSENWKTSIAWRGTRLLFLSPQHRVLGRSRSVCCQSTPIVRAEKHRARVL